jgi:mannose-6-phosphate isomerase
MIPKIIEKPWGREEIWGDIKGKYLGKTIHINMKNRLSLQYHENKEETIYVIRGVLTLITMPDRSSAEIYQKLGPGQCYHIPPGLIHRFSAESGDVVIAEVSTYYPDDVIRLEDDYNR